MDVLDARYELVGQEKHGLQREFAVTEVEKILQTGTQQVDDHGVIVTFGAEPADKRNTDTTGERLVDASLIFQLGVLGLDALELDGDFLTGDDVGTCTRQS